MKYRISDEYKGKRIKIYKPDGKEIVLNDATPQDVMADLYEEDGYKKFIAITDTKSDVFSDNEEESLSEPTQTKRTRRPNKRNK